MLNRDEVVRQAARRVIHRLLASQPNQGEDATNLLFFVRRLLNAEPHVRQIEILTDPTRFKVVVCGRRFGKTMLGTWLCMAVAYQGGVAWWVAPAYPVASIGWRMLKSWSYRLGGAQVRESERMIFIKDGWVQVKSADNPDSLRGEGLHLVVMDEAAYIREEAWYEALRPALADHQGRALFITTPNGFNWIYALFTRGLGLDSEWKAWQFPTWDNPHVSADEISAARSGMDDLTFRQEFGAEFTAVAGLIYDNFSFTENVTLEADYVPERHVFWACDDGYAFGNGPGSASYHPRVVLIGQETATGGFNVFAEYTATGVADYNATIDSVLKMGYAPPEIAYCDSSAQMFLGALHGRGIAAIGASHPVAEGIRNVRAFICDANGVRRLKIHPRCTALIREMGVYRKADVQTGGNDTHPLKQDDHHLDALRYALWVRRYVR